MKHPYHPYRKNKSKTSPESGGEIEENTEMAQKPLPGAGRGRGRGITLIERPSPIVDGQSTDRPSTSNPEKRPIMVSAQKSQGFIPQNVIRLDDVQLSDFTGSDEFKIRPNINVNNIERTIIDNVWIAYKNRNTRHIIACLNGLGKYFTHKVKDHPAGCDMANLTKINLMQQLEAARKENTTLKEELKKKAQVTEDVLYSEKVGGSTTPINQIARRLESRIDSRISELEARNREILQEAKDIKNNQQQLADYLIQQEDEQQTEEDNQPTEYNEEDTLKNFHETLG